MKKIKDPVSGFSHLLGMFLSIAGLVLLIITAANDGNGAYEVVSFTIFGISLILLYAASSFYHLLNLSERVDILLKKIDHIMIYVLIAGTYTPVCLGPLRGGWGWSIFGIVWTLAIARNNFNNILDKSPKMAYYRNISRNGLDCFNCGIPYDYKI